MPVQMGQSQPKRGDLICAGSVCEKTGAGSLMVTAGSMLVNPVAWPEPPCNPCKGLNFGTHGQDIMPSQKTLTRPSVEALKSSNPGCCCRFSPRSKTHQTLHDNMKRQRGQSKILSL